MRTPENSWLQGTLIDKSSPKSLHSHTEAKLHPRANKSQSGTDHAHSPAKRKHSPEQKRQATQSHAKPVDTPELTAGDLTALQRGGMQLHPPECRRQPPDQESLTSHASNPPTGARLHSKEEPQTARTERPQQTQQSKQDEEEEKYSAGKGTG